MKNKYETHVLPNMAKILKWAREGVTIKDIAAKIGVANSTFRKYIDEGQKGDERYSALAEAFAPACEVADDKVEHALFDRACGYDTTERIFERVLNKATGEYEEVCVRRIEKHIPPDPTSAMFWLTNRQPDKWKYKREDKSEVDTGDTGVILIPEVKHEP